jgi:hypothetical protein
MVRLEAQARPSPTIASGRDPAGRSIRKAPSERRIAIGRSHIRFQIERNHCAHLFEAGANIGRRRNLSVASDSIPCLRFVSLC